MVLKNVGLWQKLSFILKSLIFPENGLHIFFIKAELKTLELWIMRSMLDILFFLNSRLNNGCSPLVNNLQIN